MERQEILEILESAGVFITGSHFILTSGRHSPDYIDKNALYPHVKKTALLCAKIAKHFTDRHIDVVVAPALGGIALSQWTAFALEATKGYEVLSLFAKKDDVDKFAFLRGYAPLLEGRNVLVVEDILTTGSSVKQVVELVRELRGNVVGVGAICNRGKVTAADIGDVPDLFALVDVEMTSYAPDEIPEWLAKTPINIRLGHGKKFLAAQQRG